MLSRLGSQEFRFERCAHRGLSDLDFECFSRVRGMNGSRCSLEGREAEAGWGGSSRGAMMATMEHAEGEMRVGRLCGFGDGVGWQLALLWGATEPVAPRGN